MIDRVFENDCLCVAVKADKVEKLKKAYGSFGWVYDGEERISRTRRTVGMNFSRRHDIEGKDRLQLLQVRFEVALNFVGSVKRRVNSRVAALVGFFVSAGIILALFGLLIALKSTGALFLSFGTVLISVGAVFFLLAAVLGRQLSIYYTSKYGMVAQVLKENIRTILTEAEQITGGAYASKDKNS